MLKQLNKNLFSDFSVKKVELGEVEGVLMNSEDFEKLIEKQKEETEKELNTLKKEYEDKKNEFFSRVTLFFSEWLTPEGEKIIRERKNIEYFLLNDSSWFNGFFKKKLPGKVEDFEEKIVAFINEVKYIGDSRPRSLSLYDTISSLFNHHKVDSKKIILSVHKEKVFGAENRNFSLSFFKKFLQENTPKKYYNLKVSDNDESNSFLYWFNEEADRMIFMKENFPDIQLLKATNRLLNF